MIPTTRNTLPKSEIISGKNAIGALMAHGSWGVCGCIKYCFLKNQEPSANRIMVSAPKKFFKRAVKRNLLKRRIREAYRTSKSMLNADGIDILFYYNTPVIHSSETIKESVQASLAAIASRTGNEQSS